MHCKICGRKSGENRICSQCRYFLKQGVNEETLRKMYSDDETKQVWRENEKRAVNLADAYYDFVLDNYNHIKEDSKENFGYNTFTDGIRLGLDIVLPMLNKEMQNKVKDKIKSMLEIRSKSLKK